MRRLAALALIGLLAPAPPAAIARDDPPGRAYKVAFWYELARPWSSTRYRAYDVARGEYDEAAVDRWRKTILAQHPDFGATVRDLSTVGEPGATEAERLAHAVGREKQRWADLNNRTAPRPSPRRPVSAESDRTRDPEIGRARFDRPSPGSPGPLANPPPSPFPYPYRSGPR